MIICGVCGSENQEGDAFCGVCGSFLEWEGRKVSAEREPALVAADEALEEQKGLIERVVDRLAGPGDEQEAPALSETPDEPLEVAVVEEEEIDAAEALAAEAEERALLAAEAAERARAEAEERARREAEAAEGARREAEEAEQARLQAQEAAVQEAAEAERLRDQLEQAETSRRQAQAELEREREALERLRADSEQARGEAAEAASAEARQQALEAEQARQQAEERLLAEREAVQEARAEAEAAEAARVAAEERAKGEAAAAAAAARQAAEAEQARLAAEAKAAEEAEAAKRAQRAAALVAKPKPKPKPVEPPAEKFTSTAPEGKPPRVLKPVKPTQTKVRPISPKRQQPPSRKIRPGELICGNCGEGNDSVRKFCRRCGQSLQEAVVARRPWWRRLPGRRRRTYDAGERRGRRRQGKGALAKGRAAKRKAFRVLAFVGRGAALLALLGVAGLSVGPWRPTVMGWAGDRFTSIRQFVAPQYDPVTAATAEASSAREGHPATDAIDTLSTTWWAGAGPAPGVESSLLITFPGPVDIAIVGIISGAADVREFPNVARPAKLHLLFDNGYDVEVEVADRHEFQHFKIDADRATGVSNVLVRITEVHAGQGGNDVAVTELEFKTRN